MTLVFEQSFCYKKYCNILDFFLLQKSKHMEKTIPRMLVTFEKYGQKSRFVYWFMQEGASLSYEQGSIFFAATNFLFTSTRKYLFKASKQSVCVYFLVKLGKTVTTYSSLILLLFLIVLFLVGVINLILGYI